jgi:hypothetical protein
VVERKVVDLSFSRCFQLRPGGVECDANGLRVGGVSLLVRVATGRWSGRDEAALSRELAKVYGFPVDFASKRGGVEAVAAALTNGELARAQIIALLLQLPDPSGAADERSGDSERRRLASDLIACGLLKADADWDDKHPRTGEPPNPGWFAPTSQARGSEAPAAKPSSAAYAGARGDAAPDLDSATAAPDFQDAPSASGAPATPEVDRRGEEPSKTLEQAFEEEYDDLGPVEFAKRVIQFGDHLAREGATLPRAEKDRAVAQYAFLEDRLSFWLAYEYTPPTARGNLLSAAQFLFQGVNLSGIAQPGHLPKSMLDVAADVWANDNPPLRPRFPADPSVELTPKPPSAPEAPIEPEEAPRPEVAPRPEAPAAPDREVEGLGGIVDNGEVGIVWDGGIKGQGDPFQRYCERQLPNSEALPETSKTFDQIVRATGTAISDKSLNALRFSYVKNPQRIYWRLKSYVDAAADYEPWTKFDLDATTIQAKMILLAVPEYTSPTQWRYLFAALRYGGERGVSIVITRIRE